MDDVSLIQRAHGGLQYTDVSFHSAEQQGVASGEPGDAGAEVTIAKAAKLQLVYRSDAGQQFHDLLIGGSEPLRVLRADNHWKMQDVGQSNQQLCVADQPFFFVNGDEKLVLDIDYAEYAIFHAQGAARDLSARETLDGSGAHENSVTTATANFRLEAVPEPQWVHLHFSRCRRVTDVATITGVTTTPLRTFV